MRRFTEIVLAALALAPACTTDHSGLARRPPSNEAGQAGVAGSLGGSAGSAGKGGSGGTGGTGGTKVVEPPGRAVVTFLHGVVDAPRVLFCFARDGEAGPRFAGNPAPQGGLEYGESMWFESLSGVPVTERTRVFVIAGELALVEDSDCADAVERARDEMAAVGLEPAFANLGGAGGVSGGEGGGSAEGGASFAGAGTGGEGTGAGGESGAGGAHSGGEGGATSGAAGEAGAGGAAALPEPPRLRVAELPSLPAGALDDGYSLLYASHGCLGGPAFSHELEREVCGKSYTPRNPTASAELVTLSRKVDFLHLSLQALHASQALGTLDLRTLPPESSSDFAQSIGSSMTRGSLQPKNPRADLRSEDYAIEDGGGLTLLSAGVVIWEGPWDGVIEMSGVTPVNGRVYTLVVMGPAVGDDPASFWNPTALSLVDNDPMPQ
jgi:hypothetical protein